MSDDNPYDLLGSDDNDPEGNDHRWAFGTGFTDALEGIDTSVPESIDRDALARYCLMLGDDALIYSHRLQQWITRMPELEEETALAEHRARPARPGAHAAGAGRDDPAAAARTSSPTSGTRSTSATSASSSGTTRTSPSW